MSAREQELLRALAERPFDASLRQVIADELLEQGDARGEVINLSARGNLSLSEKRRVQRLVTKHQVQWLGPLADVVDLARTKWEGGFLSEVGFQNNIEASRWADIAKDARFCTVRALSFSLGPSLPALAPLVSSPMFRSVRRVRAGLGVLTLLASAPSLFSLDEVSFVTWGTGSDELSALADAVSHPSFAAMKTLELTPFHLLNMLTASELRAAVTQETKLLARLDEVRLCSEFSIIEAATGWLQLGTEHKQLEERWHGRWAVRHHHVDYALERDRENRFKRLVAHTGDDAHELGARLALVAVAAGHLRALGLTSIDVHLPPGAKVRTEERDTLRRAARQLGTIEQLLIGGVSVAP